MLIREGLFRKYAWSFALSALAAGGILVGKAGETPYFPHPERRFELVEVERAALIASEALNRIAMAHDGFDREVQGQLRQKLLAEPSIREVLVPQPDESLADLDQRLRLALSIWLKSYPSPNALLGREAGATWGAPKLMTLAHQLVRVAYGAAGIQRPVDVAGILLETVWGPHQMYQSDRVRRLQEFVDKLCKKGGDDADMPKNVPAEVSAARWAINHGVADALSGLLGSGKSCESLARDVMAIVSPHHSPLRSSTNRESQLEGLSVHLARAVFAGRAVGNVTQAPMIKWLDELGRVDHLDLSVDEARAVREAVSTGLRPIDLFRLISLASHNHGLELYLQKAALELDENPESAAALALKLQRDLNHFYGLLSRHRAEYSGPGRFKAERPYHFWGGALVTCELIFRGYRPWVAELVSGALGKVYEGMTSSNGEGISAKTEDVNLHKDGAALASSVCKPQT